MNTVTAHIFAITAPVLASVSQLIIKWQTNKSGELPTDFMDRLMYLGAFLMKPWVVLSMLLVFLSGISWIIAMTKLELSYAYPYIAAPFALVPLLAVLFLGESYSIAKSAGALIMIIGILVSISKG